MSEIQSGRAPVPDASPQDAGPPDALSRRYWSANVRLLLTLLGVWFAVSFGAGILFVDQLNAVSLGGFPLGFWFAQQGSIYVFVLLIFIYAAQMKTIARRFNIDDV